MDNKPSRVATLSGSEDEQQGAAQPTGPDLVQKPMKKFVPMKKAVAKKKVVPMKVLPVKKAKEPAGESGEVPEKKVVPMKKMVPMKKVFPMKKMVPMKKVVPEKEVVPEKNVVPKKKVVPMKVALPEGGAKAEEAKPKAVNKRPSMPCTDANKRKNTDSSQHADTEEATTEDAAVGAKDTSDNEPESVKYALMPYASKGCCAIKDKAGGNQILQISVRGASFDQNRSVCETLLIELNKGVSINDVKSLAERMKAGLASHLSYWGS